ncbi:DUF4123 domain-containing protein [Chondromyces crocatus]|uniref:FHA domain-containing protein n=1 Tax=Chondromyces crocatus TaxID=52 RepID=A0A0K1EJU9_CHOCO|nr:DUF4123 domain-containing protein [Chondromyces crocatus]AKT41136.1 uncharacterized protein CMC5_052970 [Chondromyces crocatus]
MSRAPRLIVEIRGGRQSGQSAVIPPGGKLRVGRTAPSDLFVANDRQMSGVHFGLSWDGARCQLEDLGSAQGTLLNGEPVKEAEVAHGAWIRAGDSSFMVYVEGASTPPKEDPTALADLEARVLSRLRAEKEPLFAVLDAARDPRILPCLRESVEAHRSLYDGVKGEALSDVAPHLVALTEPDGLLERLVQHGWGQSWGIFLTSRRPLDDVRTHFRRILMVNTTPGAPRLYFRFYDPRVLRTFLPICTPAQQGEMFGKNGCFLMEGDHGEVLRFTQDAQPAAQGAS